jgi:hypothetical protein
VHVRIIYASKNIYGKKNPQGASQVGPVGKILV